MGIIQKVFRYFSPEKKKGNPSFQKLMRSYAGAKSGRLMDFVGGTRSADDEIRWDIRKLRDRCRELARNNDYAKRYISLMKTNVIGEMGIQLQADSKNPDGTDDDAANNQIEREWELWCKKGNCTVDGKYSWIDCQDIVLESMATEGEVLIQLVNDKRNPWGFAIKFLDNDMLDEEYNETLSNGHEVRMGVEVDQNDKPVAYWLWDFNQYDYLVKYPHSRKRRRIPAGEIIHMFKSQRPNQNRGVPPMATSILDLQMLDGYIEAELTSARVASSKMGFYQSADGGEYKGDGVEDKHTPLQQVEPGIFELLPPGMTFQSFDPQHPTSQFKDFIKQVLRAVASGTNVSYASLSNDLESVNYSSIRQGALEERHHFKKEQRFVIEHFLQPVYERWLLMAMTKGKLSLPVAKFEKFSRAKWMPRGFGYIDPLKEVQSYILAINNGFMTLQDVAAIHGRDVKSLFEAIQKEKQMAEKFGIKLAVEPFGDKADFVLQQEQGDGTAE